MAKAAKGLTTKQQAFVRHYAATLSAAKSAKLAGYSPTIAKQEGHHLLTLPAVRASIAKEIKKQSRMPTEEIISRLERQASSDISIFFKAGTFELDPEAFHENGDLVQLVMQTKEGMRLRLHDSQKALELLGKARALFVERTVLEAFDGMEILDSGDEGGKDPPRTRTRASRAAKED